jgi:hypothetical protein
MQREGWDREESMRAQSLARQEAIRQAEMAREDARYQDTLGMRQSDIARREAERLQGRDWQIEDIESRRAQTEQDREQQRIQMIEDEQRKAQLALEQQRKLGMLQRELDPNWEARTAAELQALEAAPQREADMLRLREQEEVRQRAKLYIRSDDPNVKAQGYAMLAALDQVEGGAPVDPLTQGTAEEQLQAAAEKEIVASVSKPVIESLEKAVFVPTLDNEKAVIESIMRYADYMKKAIPEDDIEARELVDEDIKQKVIEEIARIVEAEGGTSAQALRRAQEILSLLDPEMMQQRAARWSKHVAESKASASVPYTRTPGTWGPQ